MKFVEEKEYTYIIEEQNISTIIKTLMKILIVAILTLI
jgi:hypothetical protein